MRAWIVIVWLLAGAAVNLGVAWSIALARGDRLDSRLIWRPRHRDDREPWLVPHPVYWEETAHTEWTRSWGADFADQWLHLERVNELGRRMTRGDASAGIWQYGIPARTLAKWYTFRSPPLGTAQVEFVDFRVRVPLVGTLRLPNTPLWPGLVLNTLFYAALAWGVWQLPLALRRRRRRARGQCVRCGYALAGLPTGSPCPECGPSTAK